MVGWYNTLSQLKIHSKPDRHAPTVEAISGPHSQVGNLHWCHFTSLGFTRLAKTLWKSRLVDINQWIEAVNLHSYLV